MQPAEAVPFESQFREEGRSDAEGMHGGAEIMNESGQSQLAGTSGPSRLRRRFANLNLESRLSRANGGSQAIWPTSDYNRGWRAHFSDYEAWARRSRYA